uniref:Uncharacterized protein n=1 Tax=Anguilla anguilla TaxID=7936 RepID=A0A0E9XGY5_ANGAN
MSVLFYTGGLHYINVF